MALLFHHLRAHAVFGANTDVGKTLLTTALARAAAASPSSSSSTSTNVFYLKPVSTGPPEDADDGHVRRFAGPHGAHIDTRCLFRYDAPVSPHLAAHLHLQAHTVPVPPPAPAPAPATAYKHSNEPSRPPPPSDAELVSGISAYLKQCARAAGEQAAWAWVETAGGVLSPSLSATPQADTYRPLRLPIVLIGDARLGGISATLSAYESLLLRGYDVPCVMLFRDAYYRNYEYLERWFARSAHGLGRARTEGRTSVVALPPAPARHPDAATDVSLTEAYYTSLVSGAHAGPLAHALATLDAAHAARLADLASMPRRTRDVVWWPFTQHAAVERDADVLVVDSACGDMFAAYAPPQPTSPTTTPTPPPGPSAPLLHPLLDSSASWWTQSHGHSVPALTRALAHASGRYGHVLFPSATHAPALALAERLVAPPDGPGAGWAARVFFSDDGSTAVEVALKMAVVAAQRRRARNRLLQSQPQEQEQEQSDGAKQAPEPELEVLGLSGSYHGDTIGAMDASEPGTYNAAVPWYRGRGAWFVPPTVSVRRGRVVLRWDGHDGANEVEEEFPSLAAAYDVRARLASPRAGQYEQAIRRRLEALARAGRVFGALLLEPLLLGAGGMKFVDPLFQRVLVDVVRSEGGRFGTAAAEGAAEPGGAAPWQGLPVIFDEVFVGFSRLGVRPSAVLGVAPDIAVYAKILTAGLVPMAVTLASASVYGAFLGGGKVDALLHGHSYTAHPIGCAVACRGMDLVREVQEGEEWARARGVWRGSGLGGGDGSRRPQGDRAAQGEGEGAPEPPLIWSLWDPEFVRDVSMIRDVEQSMAMGTVLAIDLATTESGYATTLGQQFVDFMRATWTDDPDVPFAGIHARTLGNTLYFMTSLNTKADVVRGAEKALLRALSAWAELE